ncbi:MAG: pinensin family lanthipeptide [Bacteroidota bacterium]
MKKLKLNELKVQSFVIKGNHNLLTLKGGSNNCQASEFCGSELCSGDDCDESFIEDQCQSIETVPPAAC